MVRRHLIAVALLAVAAAPPPSPPRGAPAGKAIAVDRNLRLDTHQIIMPDPGKRRVPLPGAAGARGQAVPSSRRGP